MQAANARGSNNPVPRLLIQHGNADSSTTLWIWTFILASVGFVVLVLIFWAMGGLGELGLSGRGVVALMLGFLFTVGLAIGLMALVFFSDRSGRDDEANWVGEREARAPFPHDDHRD